MAFLKAVRSDYLCPNEPPTRPATHRHLMAHLSALWDGGELEGGAAAAAPAKAPAAAAPQVGDARGAPLARLLQLYTALRGLPPDSVAEVLPLLPAILADAVCRPRIAATLAELEGLAALGAPPPPPGAAPPTRLLTLAQLEAAVAARAVHVALQELAPREGPLSNRQPLGPRQRVAITVAALKAADALTAVDPANPKAWSLAAAAHAMAGTAGQRGRHLAASAERAVRSGALAREQGSSLWAADAAVAALPCCLDPDAPGKLAVPPAVAAQALSLYAEAAAACARVEPCLPPVRQGMRGAA